MTIAVDVSVEGAEAQGGERGYRELVEAAPDMLARFEVGSGRLLFVNRAVERITGRAPTQFYADPTLFACTIAAEYRDVWEAALVQAGRGDARSFDLGLLHLDGRQLIVQQSLYPICDEAGQVLVIEGTARDITAIRQIEQLKARNEERAALDRLKSQLLANVSHELRTPLVSIKGYNELLLRGALGPLTPRQRRGLEIAGANRSPSAWSWDRCRSWCAAIAAAWPRCFARSWPTRRSSPRAHPRWR
jgi:PAS domain S-box-containing protein